MSFFQTVNWWSENIKQMLWRGLIVLATIIACAVLAPRIASTHKYAIFILVAIIGIMGIAFLLKYPQIGLVGLIGASLVIPFSIGTGSESSLSISILLVGLMSGLMVVDIMIHQFRFIKINSRPILPVLVMLVISILAFGSGQLGWFATQPAPLRAQIGGMALFILSGMAFLLVAYYIQELRWLEWMTWIFLALSAIPLARYIFPSLSHLDLEVATGSLFWTWIPAIAFSQVFINKRLAIIWRFLLGVLIFAWFYVSLALNRDWVSGWLPGLVSILVIVWLYEKKLRLPLLFIFIVGLALKFQSLYNFIMVGDNQYSMVTRLAAWQLLEEIIKVNPILGVGFANYYWYTYLFPIMGYSVMFNSHNNYIDIIAQTGIIGLVCFLWIAWELGRLGLSLKERAPEGFAKAYIYGALGGLVGTLVSGMLGDWVLPFVYNVGFIGFRASMLSWIFLGGLISVEQIVHRHEKIPDNLPM
jgi:hypothetical protein